MAVRASSGGVHTRSGVRRCALLCITSREPTADFPTYTHNKGFSPYLAPIYLTGNLAFFITLIQVGLR